MVIELAYNLSVLVAISVLSNFMDARFDRKSLTGKTLQGILFGTTAIIGMLNPFILTTGLIFDGRTIVLSLCTLFFGPIAGGISATMAIIYRIYIGGVGLPMGISTIVSAAIIGYLFYIHRQKHSNYRLTNLRLYAIGVIVHIVMLTLILTVPSKTRWETYKVLSLTILGIYPFATLLIGKILLDQEENQEYVNEIKAGGERYKRLINSIRDSILVIDLERKVTDCNPAFSELFGYSREEITGKETSALYANEEEFQKMGKRISENQGNRIYFQEMKFKKKNGEVFPAEGSTFFLRESQGSIVGYIALIRDISERKMLEREKFGLLEIIENSLNEIYIFDAETLEFQYANQRTLSNIGYSIEELAKKKPTDLKPLFNYESFNDLIQPLKNGEVEKLFFETIHRRKNGTEYPVEVHLQVSTYKNKPAFISVINDISERKLKDAAIFESNEQIRLLLENSADAILLTHPRGRILKANAATTKIFEYSEEEIMSTSRATIIDLTDSRLEQALEERDRTGHFRGELTGQRKDGTKFPIYLSSSIFKTKGGETLTSMIIRDITEQKRAEETIKERMAELEKFNKFMIGRENKMIMLKKEINELCRQLNLPEKYSIPIESEK
ncbi:MAG: PAS domain S-box protein [Ignavibacteriaceae bacterium]